MKAVKAAAMTQPDAAKTRLNAPTSDEGGSTEEELTVGGFHALEHTLIESSDMLTGGGRNAIGGVSMGSSGLIFIYDGSPGGSGLSKLLFDRLEEALRRVTVILDECTCEALEGCPACTFSYQCGNNNYPLFKDGANEAAQLILQGEKVVTESSPELTEDPLI
jgi:DEAD/DEAH box helicase domain-containing protein